MSVKVAENNERGALKMFKKSATTLLMFVLPIVGIGAVLSVDVIKFAYMRGKFTLEDVNVTAGILLFYIVGLPAFGMRDFLSRMFHALKDTKTPFRVSCMVVAINIVLNFILRAVMGANGLAFATSIAGYCGTAAMIILLRKHFGRIGLKRTAIELAKILTATAISVVVCIVMNRIIPDTVGTIKVMLRLMLCAGVSLIAYAASAYALRVRALRSVMKRFTGRKQ